MQVGYIHHCKDGVRYQVQNKTELTEVIIPLFDYYSLFSWQYACYEIFKESIIIRNASYYQDKNCLNVLKNQLNSTVTDYFYDTYKAPAFNFLKPSKAWIVGFVEAEGTFGIKKKRDNFYYHYFNLRGPRAERAGSINGSSFIRVCERNFRYN